MPNARSSKAFALLLVGLMVAAIFVAATSARARSDEPSGTPAATASRSIVSPARESASPTSSSQDLLGKIPSDLQKDAQNPQTGAYVSVVIHTTNVPATGKALERVGAQTSAVVDGTLHVSKYVARPWGAVGTSETIQIQVPQAALLSLASLPFVEYI